MTTQVKQVYQGILNRQREWLLEKNSQETGLNEDLIRKPLQYLNLEEEQLGYI
ncbi:MULTISPECIES: hypothetical protein [Mucilaginibacter]|uniref:Uncharacterized protein n=1 Tax=Mucilaginibacter rubeus TaxID=2027860 RepID=A0ABX7UCE4_9SPHI|nr:MULTISPECIES: hypothetical protein [Mucilaginibacter]QTE43673.1 hypothetical protein J3L19_32930 [Mucilaginibacter rubeus]QTE50273.1 hypothetical protein J3L21_32885 [Mucilaginibacter rubeus]QTE55360.1 hypothetical protein J3L23_24500 [Mucilaginibacter rubeus]QTE65180.1 hypothetical protein J3L22_09320 [Mucilaginibacter rubeus]QTF63933.1 hypothetical protein J3L20_08995 [Mucilaginibacter rubeus]